MNGYDSLKEKSACGYIRYRHAFRMSGYEDIVPNNLASTPHIGDDVP
jgi:hypothetical protein